MTSAATRPVEIAEELYTFGCISEQRGGSMSVPGDDPVAVHTFASPKKQPGREAPAGRHPPGSAEVYQATYGDVPSATALGNAMTVLEGKARKTSPVPADKTTLAAFLGGGKDSIATKLVEVAHEPNTLGVTTTGEAYAVPVDGPNVARVLRGGRRSLRAELAKIYFEQTKAAANAQALADALLVLEGERTVSSRPRWRSGMEAEQVL